MSNVAKKLQLKAERVQEPEATLAVTKGAPATRLKAERVQARLKSAPGWILLPSGRSIGRVREFVKPAHAEAFAAFVARLSLAQRHAVTIDLAASQVIVTLHGPFTNDSTGRLTGAVLGLAAAIG
jgi:pterin-4a-carbinolamine dehydratase